MKENSKRNGGSSRLWQLAYLVIALTLPAWYFDLILVDVLVTRSSDGKVFSTSNHDDIQAEVQKHTALRHIDEKVVVADYPPSQNTPASGQHLLLDLKGSNFEILNNEAYLRQATLRIIEETKMHLLGIQSRKLQPQGVSVIAMLAESHLSIHTWPEFGSALIDLFTCGDGANLQEHVEYVVQQYGGDITASTYSIVPRGVAGTGPKAEMDPQFQPAEIMTIHKYKRKIFEVQSPFQHIAIWDHHDTQEDDFSTSTMRSLFLDGVIQSNAYDEEKYHESLVHPAFVGAAEPVKRVLIVGGGEGGTLRECLKWKSVEKVYMVELDKAVVDASREYLPSYSNCTGFGTESCFDDPRVKLYTEDFIKWFDKYMGNDICEKSDSKEDLLFDVIVLDLLDSEALPEDEDWADHLYSDLFFERIGCATSRFGVVVSNFGEAPEAPFGGGPAGPENEEDISRRDMFLRKIEQIQTMSKFFHHFRVYDTAVPSYRANWAFALGMVPKHATTEDDGEFDEDFDDDVIEGVANAGVNAFDGKVAMVNLKINRGLLEKAHLEYYDGAVQHSFQYPTGDWQGVYCTVPENKEICGLPNLFRKGLDYEEEWFETRVNAKGDESSGTIAKKDIPKGFVTGMYDAATSIELPATVYYALEGLGKEENTDYHKFYEAIDRYAFDGGLGETGDTIFMSAGSYHIFSNHACDHKPTFGDLSAVFPSMNVIWDMWNPVADRFRSEINHALIATRDIKKGEMLTNDYTGWDGFIEEDVDGNTEMDEWCGRDKMRRLARRG